MNIKQISYFIAALAFASHSTLADQLISDDLIVDGSVCTGLDCVNGEAFGFDTLKLKENNLRIKFEDTSNSASFPSNDWQLVANDSSNGGQNRFSIEDVTGGRTPFTIEAGAPNHSLYVDDGGRVGMGTSTPVVEMHIVDGDTPTMRLQQDGSSGFTPQTWDVAGNETNFFVRDATNGSSLPFRISGGAPQNSIFIASDGDVGLGSDSPNANLDIKGPGPTLRFTNTGAAASGWDITLNANKNRLNFRDIASNKTPLKIEDASNENLLRLGQDTSGAVDGAVVSIGSTNTGLDATLQVQGSIQVDGVVEHADFVFAPDYALMPIQQRADFMWEKKHLPALPKAPEGLRGNVDLVSHQMGILEELEVAHIYIQQLHKDISSLEARLNKLEALKN
jgi:hypothetical protein